MPTFLSIVQAGAGCFLVGLMGLAFDAIRTAYLGIKHRGRTIE